MSVAESIRCRICGCSDAEACEGGCWWVEDPASQQGDLCSSCFEIAVDLHRVTATLEESRFVWATEHDLQAGIAAALVARGLDVEHEVRIDARNRLDLRVGRVGIEVKVDGSWRDVRRQLERYAALDSLTALVLVTSRPSHSRIGPELSGKPVVVHRVGSTL